MKNITKSLLSLICSALILAGCSAGCLERNITTTSPRNYPIIKQENKITKENEIYRYFTGEKIPFKKIGESLEKIVEEDMSDIFDLNIDLVSIYYGDAGCSLYITEKGNLKIIYSQSFLELTEQQKKIIKSLAEVYGPEISNINLNVEKFKKEDIDKKEKKYSAYIADQRGITLDLLIGHYIRVNPSNSRLYFLVHTIAHEGTHTLIDKESTPRYLFSSMLSEFNLVEDNEKMAINETACDIIANKVNRYFKENHLIKGAELYNDFEKTEKFDRKYNKEMAQMISEYELIPEELRLTKRIELFKKFEERIKNGYGFKNFKINEAKLALSKRYSGSRIIENKLNFLYDKLGAKEFVETIPYLYSIKDLEAVCGQLK